MPLDEFKKQGKVLLIRHSHEYLDIIFKINLIDEYQSFQSKPAFLDCKYIVSFLENKRKRSVFYGIFEVIEILKKDKLHEYC